MKIRLYHVLIGIVVIAAVVAGCFIAQQQQNKQRFYFLSFHCNNINSDFTRPAHRKCVRPVSLKNNIYLFVNQGGIVEQYLIIEINGGTVDINHNTFVYDFIKYNEE